MSTDVAWRTIDLPRLPLRRLVHVRTLLVAVGLVLGVVGAVRTDAVLPDPLPVMGLRETSLQAAMRAQGEGLPPLLGIRTEAESAFTCLPTLSSPGRCVHSLTTYDDAGAYLWVPAVARVTGESDPDTALRWIIVASFALVWAAYPLLLFELFGSLAAALVAPFALLAADDAIVADVYWASAWIVLLGVPSLLVLARHWRRLAWPGTIAIALLASYANTWRSGAGLGVGIALALLIVACEPAWRRRLTLLAVGVVAFHAVSPYTVQSVERYRDDAVGLPGLTDEQPFRGGIWHTAYIGLGALPNPYGIAYRDEIAIAKAREVDPDVEYLSPHYFEILRHEYVEVVRRDPGYVADVYVTKLGDAVRDGGWLLLLAPLVLALPGGPLRRRWHLLVGVPVGAVALSQPLLAVIAPPYMTGWRALWVALSAVAAARAVALASDAVRSRSLVPPTLGAVGRGTAVGALGLVAVVVALRTTANPDAAFWQQASAVTPAGLVAGASVANWPFTAGTPAGWEPNVGSRVEAAGAASRLTTSTEGLGYQLVGPAVELPAGVYVLAVHGAVDDGGMTVGVLDGNGNWILNQNFAHTFEVQRRRGDLLAVSFTLAEPGVAQPVLANWRPRSGRSTWLLERVELVRR